MRDTDDQTKRVAAILRDSRTTRSLTIQELAAACGLAASRIADIEEARREVRMTELVAIARGLGTTVESILQRAEL